MTTYRFPVSPFSDLRREMERLFDEFGGRGMRALFRQMEVFPAINMWDAGDALMLEAEVPGLRQDDLEILTMGSELTIKGRRTAPAEEHRTYHRQERGTGEFSRVVTLPVEVEADRVEATLSDGVLTLKLPKAASARPRKITLRTQ
jgi:HSP20 family protein